MKGEASWPLVTNVSCSANMLLLLRIRKVRHISKTEKRILEKQPRSRPSVPAPYSGPLIIFQTHPSLERGRKGETRWRERTREISQVVSGLLPEQCLNNIVIMREQHCWTNNEDFPWLVEQGKFVLIEQPCSLLLTCLFKLVNKVLRKWRLNNTVTTLLLCV